MTVTQSYRYLASSALGADGLTLQTSGGPAANPRFFDGFLTTPRAAAAGLLAVAEVARTRYFQPAHPTSLDPVVTGSADRLRFESFSGCCGVYARLDVLPAGIDGAILGHGTTNVDVNPPLREALARVAGLDPLHLAVGPDDLTVSTMDGAVVERKVPLPPRWLRGFAEVHGLASGFEPRADLSVADATAFLRRLPAAGDRSVLWAVPSGRTLRLTSRPAPGAVCLADAGRLAALRRGLRFADRLRVFGPPVGAGSSPVASTWLWDARELRLSLTLSPEPYRGFSGEGTVLAALAAGAGIDETRARAALVHLGTAGRVGYDVAEGAYFHRSLPYDATRAERDNPRLVGARALVEAGAVTRDDDGAATVRSGTEVYRVRSLPDGGFTCTCRWWARHRGQRGPCRHALAVSMVGSS